MSFCMMNNCTVETIPASADATALLSPCSLALSVLALDGASIYAAIAGLVPAKYCLFRLLLAIFSGVCAAFYRRLADLAESPIFHRPIFANGYDVYFGAYFRSDYLHVRFAVQATGIFLARQFAS